MRVRPGLKVAPQDVAAADAQPFAGGRKATTN
jgi:hypothetical protein